MSEKEKLVMICPKCGSSDVSPDLSNPALVYGGLIPKRCYNCGHTGQVFPEVEEKAVPKKPMEPSKVKDAEPMDLTYVRPTITLWKWGILKFSGPIILLLGLVMYLTTEESIYGSLFLIILGIIVSLYAYSGRYDKWRKKQK